MPTTTHTYRSHPSTHSPGSSMDAGGFSASSASSSFYSSSHHYNPPPPPSSSFLHSELDDDPHVPPPPPARPPPPPFPYSRHLEGFFLHKDWNNVQDTVKDALFFCARALQEQHAEILALKEKESSARAALALESKVGALAAAVEAVQHQERDTRLSIQTLQAEATEKGRAVEAMADKVRGPPTHPPIYPPTHPSTRPP